MNMKKSRGIYKILVVLSVALMFSACNSLENKSKSATFIIVESIMGTTAAGEDANFLQSDVYDEISGGGGTVVADVASGTLRASLLDPASILKPSQYNDVILDRYIVSYSRVDQKNRQGIDVPYPFEGSLSQILKVGTSTAFSFVVVREVAKLEPPLINLVSKRDEGVIEVTAKIEFFGHDLANKKVTAIGYLTVFFANYAEEETTEEETT